MSRGVNTGMWTAGLLHSCAIALALLISSGPSLAEETIPFKITVDGAQTDGSAVSEDGRLEAVDIQVKFDGLGVKPMLNVSTNPIRASYQPGDTLEFLASSNYPAWIATSEIGIYDLKETGSSRLKYVVPVSPHGLATWQVPSDAPAQMYYVLRVTDSEGRFDETVPLPLSRTDSTLAQHEPQAAATAPGYSEDRTALRNIPVYGGAITVYGRNVPTGHAVAVLGRTVPLDADSAFVNQQILPPGHHTVDISVKADGKGLDFSREIEIPENEWFYVGLADLTVGYRTASDNIEAVKPGEYDDVYSKGRLAYYVKGKIKGRYLLTAAADTGEGKLQDIFRGLDGKNPREYLKRLDPDDYYPVYGDESTAVEDAPTRGKFYVRLDRGDSHVMWGNFKSRLTGTEFLRSERALYGAGAVYRSPEVTTGGDRRSEANAYAALPGTLPQRDVFRGTGGSAYFLKHQDITTGSGTVSIEIRSSVTGAVIERQRLAYGVDFDFDYVQGVILLKRPLPSSTGSGQENFLVANYEFTPVAGDADGYAYGGRAQQWMGNHMRLGATAMSEKTGAADQKLYGADLRLQSSENTFVEAEVAQTRGPGFGNTYSVDGGNTNDTIGSAGASGTTAKAYRLRGAADLDELSNDRLKGKTEAYYENFGKGFSSLDRQKTVGEENWGAKASVQVSANISTTARYDEQHSADGKREREILAATRVDIDDHWSVEPGFKHRKRVRPAGLLTEQGSREDATAVVSYQVNEDAKVYMLGNTTVAKQGGLKRDDRVGIGATTKVAEKIGVAGELSEGTLGLKAAATLDYAPTVDDHYYLGYRLDPERSLANSWPFALSGDDLGVIVAGTRHRFSDWLSAYAEDNYDMFGDRISLTQAYGVNYTPDARWAFDGGMEVGAIEDDTIDPDTGLKNSDFDRRAISLAANYHNEVGVDGRAKGELRLEDLSDNSRDMTSYLLAGGFGVNASEDWRALGTLDAVFSDASVTTRRGEYVEASVGFAYRPAEGDRFNALAKYTYLYDLPGIDQVTIDGTTAGPMQQSHIFSGDASYDLNNYLTIGAKYGVRFGEIRERSAGSSWVKSSAHLGILRADIHVVQDWDALLEGRILWQPETHTSNMGLIGGVYRHINDNFKLGVGYNFGIFSDDLRDLTYDDQGFFVNAIGKF